MWSPPVSPLDPADMAGPLPLPQLKLLDLSARGPRQLVDELDRLGGFEAGQVCPHVLEQLGLADPGARLTDHECLAPLAPAGGPALPGAPRSSPAAPRSPCRAPTPRPSRKRPRSAPPA